jgi:hypothetical protein
MDADDWLKTIEKKLQVVQCTNRESCSQHISWLVPLQIGGTLMLKLLEYESCNQVVTITEIE